MDSQAQGDGYNKAQIPFITLPDLVSDPVLIVIASLVSDQLSRKPNRVVERPLRSHFV